MSITTINNATAAVPQTQVPQTADGDAAIQGDATGKIETGDAPIIQGAGLVITEAAEVGRKAAAGNVDSTKKAVDVNEVPELDAEDVRNLVSIIEDLEKLLAELKNSSTEEQIKTTKERIASLKEKLGTEFKDRMSKIDETIDKMNEAARLKQAQEATAWMNVALSVVGAVIAVVVAAVAIAAAVASGGAALPVVVAVFAGIGALASLASTGLSVYQQVAKDDIQQEIKDKAQNYRDQGLSDSEAMKKATEDVTDKFLTASLVLAGVSLVCGLVGGFGSAAGSAVRVVSTLSAVASGLGMAGGVTGIVVGNYANDANYDSQSAQAERSHLEALLQKLKKALDDETQEIQALIQQLMDAMADLSQLLESAAKTTDEIAQQTGATA